MMTAAENRGALGRPVTAVPSERLKSIDALRGFDMFWIVGGDQLGRALAGQSNASWARSIERQLDHVPWEGFVFYDLIFPLFLFLVGCVIPFSLDRYRGSPSQVYGRVLRRTALLILMGFLYNRIQDFQWEEFRWMGVLQRIGICYGVASLLYLKANVRGLMVVTVGILLGYWAIMAWIPVPGGVAGNWTPDGNLAGFVDRTLLPGRIPAEYYGHGDNEGILSTIPAVATTLLGVFAGMWLRSPRSPWTKTLGLAGAGLALLALGAFWGVAFPIIKNLWTSSFVLVAGGWSLLLLALFFGLIDGLRWHRLAFFWIVIGVNAITIYLLQEFVSFESMASFFFSGIANSSAIPEPVVLALGMLACKWGLLLFLYRHKIFLRL